MNALIGITALVLIPGLPLTFTWVRFLQLRPSENSRSRLIVELPLCVVTGSYLIFFVFLAQVFALLNLPQSIKEHFVGLVRLNVGLPFVVGLLPLARRHSLRWRLAGAGAAVSFVWLIVGISILAVKSASG